MKTTIICSLALLALGTVAVRAETVQCPAGASPVACAQNQAIHDAFTAGSYIGPNPIFLSASVDPRTYLGSDPDANVRLALRRTNSSIGGSNGSNGSN